jgi:two-component system, sporulation sensor kinase E
MEESLGQSEERYRTIIEEMTDSYWETDLAGNYTFFNDRVCRAHQRSREELLGSSNKQFMDEATTRKVGKAFKQVYLTGEPVRGICYEMTRADGSIYYVESSVALIRNASGAPVGFRGTARDVTERRMMEQALRKSEMSLTRAQRVAHIGNWDWDLTSGEVSWSDEIYRILGFSPRQFPPSTETALAHIHCDDREAVRMAVRDALRAKEHFTIDHRLVIPSGLERWVNQQGEVILDHTGKAVQMVGTIQDITRRKWAEHALRQSERDYRNLFERATDPIFIFEAATGRILEANNRACELYGFTRPEFMKMNLAGLTRASSPAPEQIEALLSGAGGGNRGTVHYRKEGTAIDVQASASQIQYRDTKTVLAILRDVTEVNRLHDQLVHTEKLAALGRLLSGVAHELNNPLTSVIGFTQLLSSQEHEDPRTRSYIEIIGKESERTRRIVSNLLSFARQTKPSRTRVDLTALAERTLALRAFEMGNAGICMQNELSAIPTVMADEHQLQQVILNIVLNAEYAMLDSHGRGNLKVKTGLIETSEGRRAYIVIQDDGPGIPPNLLDKLFEPFFTTKPIGEGTGLGLSISYGIIREHGGTLRAENRPEGGASFTIEIPVSDGPSPCL